MDEFLKELAYTPDVLNSGFTYSEFILSIILSTVLALIMGLVYRVTHTGISYSRSFVLSMVIMSITIAFIMLIIGSNLARAFSLVGALSIVRYRNALKDSRDTAHIFLVMAIGMACGVKLYLMAILFTLASGTILITMDRMGFGSVSRNMRLLQFSFPVDSMKNLSNRIENELQNFTKGNYSLLSSEITDGQQILVYTTELSAKQTSDSILNHFRDTSENVTVKMMTGFEKFNI